MGDTLIQVGGRLWTIPDYDAVDIITALEEMPVAREIRIEEKLEIGGCGGCGNKPD